jgi:hypothetical protein
MTMGFSTTIRNACATVRRDAIDGGPAAGVIKIYSGTRPATGGAVGAAVLLATCTCSDPCGTVANGVLTFSAISDGTGTAGAGAGTQATWARIEASDGTFCADGSVTANGGGGDIQLNSTTIATGQTVKVTSGSITEGHA